MYIKQLYTNCLAQAAYYIESEGQAAIIDPLREPGPYLELLKERNASLKYVFETHFHADFVSGHLELNRATGAVIVYGPGAQPAYSVLVAEDNEVFKLGKISIKVLHTPGHTLESACFVVMDEEGRVDSVFTGDTLFIGDVGRPDLLSGNLPKEKLAEMLFTSLQKLKTLPASAVLYPGHGAGSACGKNIGKETVSTIGEQMQKNGAMLETDKNKFIQMVCSGLPAPPPYFFKDAKININGYDSIELLMEKAKKALAADQLQQAHEDGCILLDTRDALAFAKAHVPGSINIGLRGDFAVWVGTVIEFGKPIALICSEGTESEAIVRLARIGYEQVVGFLNGGIDGWISAGKKTESIRVLSPAKAKEIMESDLYTFLDVRRRTEADVCKLKNSVLIPLNELPASLSMLSREEHYVVYCAGGYRSMIAASLLRADGFRHVMNLDGGIALVRKDEPEMVIAD